MNTTKSRLCTVKCTQSAPANQALIIAILKLHAHRHTAVRIIMMIISTGTSNKTNYSTAAKVTGCQMTAPVYNDKQRSRSSENKTVSNYH